MSSLQANLSNLQSRVDSNVKRNSGGIAAASVHCTDQPGRVSLGAGLGVSNGETGPAGGFGGTTADAEWRCNAARSFTPSSGGHTDVGFGGLSYQLN